MVEIKHNIGENQKLYEKYDIKGSEHTEETEQLCEVIRLLETGVQLLKEEREESKQVDKERKEAEGRTVTMKVIKEWTRLIMRQTGRDQEPSIIEIGYFGKVKDTLVLFALQMGVEVVVR